MNTDYKYQKKNHVGHPVLVPNVKMSVADTHLSSCCPAAECIRQPTPGRDLLRRPSHGLPGCHQAGEQHERPGPGLHRRTLTQLLPHLRGEAFTIF